MRHQPQSKATITPPPHPNPNPSFQFLTRDIYTDTCPEKYEKICKIFDTKISPILMYGSEIWGVKYYESIEKVQA